MMFGKTVRTLRHQRNLTQRDLAKRLGVSHTYISKIENDACEVLPSETLLQHLEELLDTETGFLLDLSSKIDTVRLQDIAMENHAASRVLRRIQTGNVTPAQWSAMERILNATRDD